MKCKTCGMQMKGGKCASCDAKAAKGDKGKGKSKPMPKGKGGYKWGGPTGSDARDL